MQRIAEICPRRVSAGMAVLGLVNSLANVLGMPNLQVQIQILTPQLGTHDWQRRYVFASQHFAKLTQTGAQIFLTLAIFFVAIFALGFIADPIISMALDPRGHIFNLWNLFSSERVEYFPEAYIDDADPGGWLQHLTKGFASLGLLGVLKFLLSSPLQHFFRQAPVRGGRGTGRDRLQTTTWLVIVIGAGVVVIGLWKMVRAWSKRFLERAEDRVVDIHGDEDDDD
jgi:hypothetical protein